MTKRIGILTAGNDCPGLNAAIRAIGKAARTGHGMEMIAFQDGFQGLVNNHVIQPALSGILTTGGTILGTSRDTPEKMATNGKTSDQTAKAIATYREHNLDALICIGGLETQEGAYHLMQQGINVITLPKGIDNDLSETDQTIGFDTALGTATDAIDRLHSTASSHHRVIVVEIMGRNTGWLTLGSGIAGGADVIIIPEIPYDVRKICEAIFERTRSGKRFSIIAVSEGAVSIDMVEFFERSKRVNRMNRSGEDQEEVERKLSKIENNLTGSTIYLANRLKAFTNLDTRITILGHLLRGGTPSAADRVLATNLGTISVRLAQEGVFGVMVAKLGNKTVPVPLEKVIGRHKLVSPDHPWIENARSVGTHLGD
ncbi:MAG: 6-phosphofructokinase [Anaerolineaceae bacterium]|nr:6-phosphofructokinase [Anaerolineaceae bacterium]